MSVVDLARATLVLGATDPEATAGSLLDSVPGILAYGAYGLAFLLMFLVYRAIRALISNREVPRQAYLLVGMFLVVSLAFLVVAGLLQKRPVKVSVMVTPWRDDPIAVLRVHGVRVDLTDGQGASVIDVSENQEISFDADPVVTKLVQCQTLSTARLRVASRASGEQGVDDAP